MYLLFIFWVACGLFAASNMPNEMIDELVEEFNDGLIKPISRRGSIIAITIACVITGPIAAYGVIKYNNDDY